MELTKEQMEKVLYELRCSYNSRIFDDENLYEIMLDQYFTVYYWEGKVADF